MRSERVLLLVVAMAAAVSSVAAFLGCGSGSPAGDTAGPADHDSSSAARGAAPTSPPVAYSSSTTLPAVATSSVRPPLGDPPDPGPVPENHGIPADDLAVIAGSSVRVSGLACGVLSEGSGFAVGDGDLVATGAHVVLGMGEEPSIDLADGRTLPGVIVAFDPVNDLALLRVDGADLNPLALGGTVPDGTIGAVLSWDHEPGSAPVPAPSPFRIGRPVIVRTGIVAGEDQIERRSWLVAARIESGHSGAALVSFDTDEAEVIGVVWGASRRSPAGVGYATRSDELAELISSEDLTAPIDPPGCE